MKLHILLMLIGFLVLPNAHAVDPAKRAGFTLEQTYIRHGGPEQARQATMPTAKTKMRLCKLCHGVEGNSVKRLIPSLAGERPEYLLKRWYQIKEGGHGESTTATRIAQRFSEEEMIALSLYFSGIERVRADYDKGLAAQGKATFEKVCKNCHQDDGRGKDGIPMIAGQQPEYLYRTLLQFRDHEGWRHGGPMIEITRNLSPIETKAVANYATSLYK